MSEVTLHIGGRAHKLACADGEEAQLARLGNMIDEKLRQMEGNLASNEAQNLLFAALLLADELHEAREAVGDDPAQLTQRISVSEAQAKAAASAQAEMALELEAVRAERDTLANDLANIKSAASGQEPLFATTEVAPQLEQLAEMIEKCADSLEGKLSTT